MAANPRDRWRRKRFKENLHRLLTERGLTRKAAADAAEVDYDWLRRAVSRGIAWPDKRSMKWLGPLAKELGLEDVERLWSSTFTPTPGPYSIKDEAARLGELLRNYVVRVGPRDAAVQKIVGQIMVADREHRAELARQAKLPAGPPPEPAAEVIEPTGAIRSGPPAEIQARFDRIRKAHDHALEKEAIDSLEKNQFQKLRAAGLPRMDEVALDLEEVAEYARRLRLSTPDGVARFVLEFLWPSKYGEILRKSTDEARQLIERCWRVCQVQASVQAAQDGGLQANLARSVLEEFDVHYLRGYRQMGLPRVDQVALSEEDLMAEVGQDEQRLAGDSAYHLAYRPWLAKYAAHLGITWEFADRYIQAFQFFRSRGAESHPQDVGFENLRPEALVARHGAECAKRLRERQQPAREAAGPLVARVLGNLSPQEAQHFYRGYESVGRAETHLEEGLIRRLWNGMVEGDMTIPPEVQEEVVREVVAEIVQDFVKSKHGTGGDTDFVPAEPIAPDEKPMESRHGDVEPDEQLDHRGDPLPVGAALDAEIARSFAEEEQADQRQVDDILLPLHDLRLPGGGTYLGQLKRLGNPRSVAVLAIREAKGDVGKAMASLIGKIDESIEEQRLLASAVPQTMTAQVGGDVPASGPPPEGMGREEFVEFVLERSEDGESVREIALALQELEHPPTWLRKMKKAALARQIKIIISRNTSDEGPEPDEFDAQAGDDRRAWEMGYEDDPDAEYKSGRLHL